MDVSTRDNISYGTVMMPPNHSKGDEINKEGGSDSSKAATSSCDAADSTNQVEKLNDSELYEIPNSLELGATSMASGRNEEQSYIYY